MSTKKGMDTMRYQLRYAAGLYWLLDTEQPGVPYKKPLSMNRVGADIYRMMTKGLSQEQIVEALCEEYQMPRSEILLDVEQFQAQLEEYNIGDEREDRA